jgi:hypothetical protein
MHRPAHLALAAGLTLALAAQAQGGFRHTFGVGLLDAQGSGLNQVLGHAEALEQIAFQATSGAPSSQELLVQRANYRGLNLLELSATASVQVAPGASQLVDVQIHDVSSEALGLLGMDLLIPFNAHEALWGMRAALVEIGQARQGNCADQVTLGVEPRCAYALNYCSSTPNSTGQAAHLQASGPLQLSSKLLLELRAYDLPVGEIAWFVMGREEAAVPFGNGTLCVGGAASNFLRISNVQRIAWGGRAYMAITGDQFEYIDLFTPGSTWRFQCLFSDSVGAGLDATDGVRVMLEG